MHHLDHVSVDPSTLQRWREIASALGEHGSGLAGEIAELVRDPTRHRLTRAARAARQAEALMTGETARMANAIATELEVASESGSSDASR